MEKEKIEKYRFQQGSLYEYDKEQRAYVHCFKRADAKTKVKAIKAYEAELLFEEQQDYERKI